MDWRAHPVTLELEAPNPADDHHCAYVPDVGRDLPETGPTDPKAIGSVAARAWS